MVFQPLPNLVVGRGRQPLTDLDVQHFIQRWLQETLKVEMVYCERYHAGSATVRSPSPAVRATVRMLEFELQGALTQECGQTLQQLSIRS